MAGLRTRFTRWRVSREFKAPPHEAARPDGRCDEETLCVLGVCHAAPTTCAPRTAADAFVGERLKTKAVDLEWIRFEGESDGHDGSPGHVQLVDNNPGDIGDVEYSAAAQRARLITPVPGASVPSRRLVSRV